VNDLTHPCRKFLATPLLWAAKRPNFKYLKRAMTM